MEDVFIFQTQHILVHAIEMGPISAIPRRSDTLKSTDLSPLGACIFEAEPYLYG